MRFLNRILRLNSAEIRSKCVCVRAICLCVCDSDLKNVFTYSIKFNPSVIVCSLKNVINIDYKTLYLYSYILAGLQIFLKAHQQRLCTYDVPWIKERISLWWNGISLKKRPCKTNHGTAFIDLYNILNIYRRDNNCHYFYFVVMEIMETSCNPYIPITKNLSFFLMIGRKMTIFY